MKTKGCKSHVKTKQISHGGVVLFQHVTSGTYLTFTLKSESHNLCYEQEYSVLQQILHRVISFMHFEEGLSYRKISTFLNRSGIKTIRGFKWTESGSSVHSVLKKKRIRDIRLENNKKKIDYEIVDMNIEILVD